MGQIFYATAYDIDKKTCCVMESDKFHANCYSFSGSVFSIHFLLRQKPYRVMWGGLSVQQEENFKRFTRKEDLIGLSTYVNYEYFELNDKNTPDKIFSDKVKIIQENNDIWKNLDIWDEAKDYFN